ncbi:MAG TPA: regulatory protein RecX [Bryobacteraceae bacterium]|nr:regulatory protein RecX [Bryobacteraceae bacterium]
MRNRRPARKLTAEELFEHAVRHLAISGCSSEELKNKLRVKAIRLADIDGVIERLRDIGYLNDTRFAESYASSRVENAGLGRARVLSDLRGRRIPPALAEKAVEQAFEGKNEAELIEAYIDRRMPSLRVSTAIEDERELAKAYRRLRRAGFTSGPVMQALKRRAARPEMLEEPAEDEREES